MDENFIVRGLENLSKLRVLDTYLVGHKGFVAGGCFKNIFNDERLKDIDIFFENSKDFTEAKIYFEDHEDYFLYYENPKVVSFKNSKTNIAIELVCTVYGKPLDIIKNFDFTITKMAYYNEIVFDEDTFEETVENKIVHHKDFFEHLFFKRLVIDENLKFPVSSFERSYRYKGYGYSLCRESKAKLVESIRAIENLTEDISKSLYDGMD